MGKISSKYLEVNPFKIIEFGFHSEKNQESESIFSLANEYMGVRGSFDEGSSLKSLRGTYFNGIYDYSLEDTPNAYKGIVKRSHFTINSVDFFKCLIEVDGIKLDFAKSRIVDFIRILDMHNGLLTREFTWLVKNFEVHLRFERFLDMDNCHNAYQRISISCSEQVKAKISFILDNNVLHWGSTCYWKQIDSIKDNDVLSLTARTLTSGQSLAASMIVISNIKKSSVKKSVGEITKTYEFKFDENEKVFERYVNVAVDKFGQKNCQQLLKDSTIGALVSVKKGFEIALNSNKNYFDKVWERSDIEIVGDDEDQQGIRYCIFQLEQNYHGYEFDNNIGAKGLTGEAYSGHAFWDSETYCLPYYLFNNKEAAKNLLMFRYNTLEQAKTRAKMLDCDGACYPIATRNGLEGCTLWQHASCQFQPTSGVGYAIFHYMNLYDDKEFMQNYGLEMMVEICKFFLSRGQYNSDNSGFGYYGVMGPDEFQLMVNNNTYTNFMAAKMFDYLFEIIDSKKYKTRDIFKKCGLTNSLLDSMKDARKKMIILYNEKTKLYEQHDGFYKLPHIDIHTIPVTDFPLYSHWSYDRIYRNDIIKQPDVLMFMFLYSSEFSLEQKRANYEYYEPKCLHESSLSPSVHSIFAMELGKEKEATDFFSFATRLDLDDYNRNTCEGLHMTSISAAWMNIIYGFLGLRSDGKILSINPKIPAKWQKYSANITYLNRKIKFTVSQKECEISLVGDPVEFLVNGRKRLIKNGSKIKL